MQESVPGSILQLVGEKAFRYGSFTLNNELVFQQRTDAVRVQVPQLMGRHSFTLETAVFGNALQIATGLEARWHTPFPGDGYSPIYNRFYYQTAYTITNFPELGMFFNFRVKRFRAFVNLDQLQQTFRKKSTILAPGYPAQDFMLRFGFTWIMVN
jgi:hypothetical protein